MFDQIKEAIKDIQDGKFVILIDDEDRENEGDLVIAADKVTPGRHQFHGHSWSRTYLSRVNTRTS